MKKRSVALTLVCVLALVSCAVNDDGATQAETTIQTEMTTQAQEPETTQAETTTQARTLETIPAVVTLPPQEINPLRTRLPTWAMDMGLTADDTQSVSRWHSYHHSNSAEELAARSNRYIARVEVLDARVEILNSSLSLDMPRYDIYTVYRLRVLEVFRGDTRPGEVIELAQTGGQWGGLSLENMEFAPIAAGGEYVMFLGGVDPAEFSDFPDARFAAFAQPMQGVYRVTGTGALEHIQPDRECALPKRWTLTMDDLQRIARELWTKST